ncbi:hypothetical protein [Herbaspirillum sp. SJZ107]|uniref:hypothetical protein n=1 Tax=Herbaspirillum sp. SJZ107 TaxID=2572881 RepID=UPI00114D6A17|nr:hypothetical protein [Herbaspirillum sp. SJZ107]
MRAPIAFAPLRIISVKQQQDPKPQFAVGSTALLRWCDEPNAPVHLALRSMKAPMFALDALQAGQFRWSADLIAQWQPDWNSIAARGTREIEISGQKYEVFLPLRIGLGYTNNYSFTVNGKLPVRLTTALIESISSPGPPEIIRIVSVRGSVSDTWVTTIPFSAKPKGVFRVTLGEDVEQAGASTEPIYLLHHSCTTK